MAKSRDVENYNPHAAGEDYNVENGNLHEQSYADCPPDNFYATYKLHGGDPTPKDDNANGSPR